MRFGVMALLFVLLAAGCVDAPPEETNDRTAPEPPTSVREPIVLSPCLIVEALGSASEVAAREHLPDDFAPIVIDDGTVRVIFGMADCEGDGGGRAFVAMPVEPQHPDLMDENVSRHFYEPEHDVVRGDGFAEALERMGASPTWLSSFTFTGSAASVSGRAQADDFVHTMEVTGPSATPYDTPATTFREWFPGEGGYAYLDAHFGGEPGEQSGTVVARLQLGEGTVARDLLGPEATLQAVRLDPGHYNDAFVGFVPFPTS